MGGELWAGLARLELAGLDGLSITDLRPREESEGTYQRQATR